MKKFFRAALISLSLLLIVTPQLAKACHAIALVNVSIVNIGSGINCLASSDSPTCGCGNYWLDVEVQCNGCPFQGGCQATNAYGPFIASGPGCYGSTQMAKNSCIVQAYPIVFIPFAGLCPGVTYKLQMREHHGTASPPVGPWSATFTFTTPGIPPVVTSFATATPPIICLPQTSQLNCGYTVTPSCNISGCPVSYSWVPAASLNNPLIQNPVASPTVTTTYTVYFIGGCVPIPPATVTVTVSAAPVAGVASVSPTSVCAGSCVTLTLTGYSGNSIQWQSGPTAGGPWTNIVGATTTPYLFCPVNANIFFQCVVTNSCGTVTSNVISVTVNPALVININPNPASICIGSSVVLTATGATTYAWSPATGLSCTTCANPTANPTVTTTYTVTGTTGPCNGTATVTVTVNSLPVVTINPNPTSICIGSSVALTASGAATYAWAPATGLSCTTCANPSANPTVTTTYTVTGTSAAGCTATATVVVTVNPLPVVSILPNNPAVCTGGNVVLTASGANTYVWTPAIYLSATIGASVTCTPLATTTYTVTGTNAFGCTSTATVTVTVNASITVSINPNPTAICIGGSVVLNGNGATTYAWAPATGLSCTTCASPTANPTITTTYTVTGTSGSGCTGTATVVVTVNPLPTISVLPAAPSYCFGGNVNLTASGASTYVWSPATNLSSTTGATVNANPTVTTTYTVVGTTAAGCTNQATVTVTVNPLPIINVPAASTCPNIPVVLNASGASTYVWTPAIYLSATTGASVTCTPAVTTTYTITGTDVNGCTAQTTCVVTVANNFVVTATPSDTICTGASLPLTCTTGASYVWTPATGLNCTTCQNPTATPTATTTYSVTVTTPQGCTGSTTVTITVDPPITLAIAGFPETCAGACDGQAVVIPSGGIGGPFFLWSNGGTGASINNVCAGPYSVVVTDAIGCTATATTNVPAAPPIVLTQSVTTAHCNLPDGSATVNASGGTGSGWTYSWTCTPSQSTSTASNLTPGNYCCYVKDGNNCLDTICVQVPNASGVVATIQSFTMPSCFGGTNGTATCNANGGISPYTYAWSTTPVQTTNIATGLSTGSYTCIVTDASGCTDTAVVIVTQPTQVTVAPMAAQTLCIGQCVTLTAVGAGGTPGYTYSWSVNNLNVCPVVTTTYTVWATDANGCISAPQTVTLTVNPALTVVASANVGICPGSTTNLTAQASGGSGSGYGYSWAPATGLSCSTCQNPIANPATTTTYTVYATDNCGTPMAIDSVTVTVYPLPVVSMTADTNAGCVPLCINLTDGSSISSGTITNWAWTMTGANPSTSSAQNPSNVCYTTPGIYQISLIATSNFGCTTQLGVPYMVTVYPLPNADFTLTPQPTTILNPQICFTDASTGGVTKWSWDFGDPNYPHNTDSIQNPCHTYTDSGTYCVTLNVMNSNNCEDSVVYCLRIDPDYVLYVPNAFTPNGNGINDIFLPKGIGVDENTYKLWIYDRWGNMIFFTEKWGKGWDGHANDGNEVAQEDVYIWKIVVNDIFGNKHSLVGHVAIVE